MVNDGNGTYHDTRGDKFVRYTLAAALTSAACMLFAAGCGAVNGLSKPKPSPAPDPQITWTAGEPAIPTDPREQAVWYWGIESAYATNTLNFVRPAYSAVTTNSVVNDTIWSIQYDITTGESLGVHLGPGPKVFLGTEEGDDAETGVVTYCGTELWVPYDGEPSTQTETGRVHTAEVTRAGDGKWRVGKSEEGSEECSLSGAAVGYFDPKPEPSAPGVHTTSDLVVPIWFSDQKK